MTTDSQAFSNILKGSEVRSSYCNLLGMEGSRKDVSGAQLNKESPIQLNILQTLIVSSLSE